MYTNKEDMEENRRDIYERIYKLVLSCIEYVQKFPNTLEAKIIAKQLIRSSTSIGANAQEADGSESKAEFLHRFSIAKKEAKETAYWLRIAEDVLKLRQIELRGELRQIILIISSIMIKVKAKNNLRI